jgi:hypothetical protein
VGGDGNRRAEEGRGAPAGAAYARGWSRRFRGRLRLGRLLQALLLSSAPADAIVALAGRAPGLADRIVAATRTTALAAAAEAALAPEGAR